MTFAAAATSLGLALLSLAAAGFLVWRVRAQRAVPWTLAALLVLGGAAASVLSYVAERALFRFTDLSVDMRSSGLSAFLALLLFAAPLEEATKVLVVWPTVLRRRLDGAGLGVTFAVSVASGFAAADAALFLQDAPWTIVRALRALAGMPVHAFGAGVWGYALGDRVRGRQWFGPAWLGAVGLHVLYDHIVFARGPGLLVAAVPMLLAMAFLGWIALRDIAPSRGNALPGFPIHLPEPPSLRAVRRALRAGDQPLLLRWIAFGAFVNVGTTIAFVALAVVIARRFGVDLALADEADMRASGPFVLVGAAVLAAFPVSGFLIARASGAHSVLEPAFAAALAIAGVAAALSFTAPGAVVFVLAIAPVAFGLSCGGAWFGMDS